MKNLAGYVLLVAGRANFLAASMHCGDAPG
jgi:hypothetical protein